MEDLFPVIDEEPFWGIYSQMSSNSNTLVNIYFRVLIIKELFGISNDEMVEHLMSDHRYQHMLDTITWTKQPLSDIAFSHFQIHCYDADLLHEYITILAAKIARITVHSNL